MDSELKQLDITQAKLTELVAVSPTEEKKLAASRLLIKVLLRKQEIFKQQLENLKR